MIVVDTSAIIDILIGTPDARLVRRVEAEATLHAPHLIDIEALSTLRRLVTLGELTVDQASQMRVHFSELSVRRYPHHHLSERIWQLGDNLTPYDATFVALSEALEVPLITCDAGLAAAQRHSARIELYANG